MPLYELVNPSDPYTLEADFQPACLAALLLGEGWHGLTDGAGVEVMPVLALGAADEWFLAAFGLTVQAAVDAALDGPGCAALRDALRSVVIGSAADRAVYTMAVQNMPDPAKRVLFAAQWHNTKRSSLNDIGARAWALAAALEKREAA